VRSSLQGTLRRFPLRRLSFGLLLISGLASAQDSFVYYRPPSISGASADQCTNPEVFAESPGAVAALKAAQNNALTSCTPGSVCFDPVILVEVTETSHTVESVCNGGRFTHPIFKIPNPKQDPCCEAGGSNPISAAHGAKTLEEVDYTGPGGELRLARMYNSARDPEKASGFGESWRHAYMRRLSVIDNATNNLVPIPYHAAFVRRPNGQIFSFKKVSGVWQPDGDVNHRLVELFNESSQLIGRRLTLADGDVVETYNLAGRVTSIQQRNGRTETLAYSDGTSGPNGGFLLDANGDPTTSVIPAGILIRVTDPFGRALVLGYNTALRISKVTDPAGGIFRYQYDAAGNLISVTYPDTRIRQYIYNEPANTSGANLPRALTGIVDENEVRFATYKYDPQGRGISTEHANGVSKFEFAYSTDASGNPVSTTVTDPLATARVHGFQTVLGALRATGRDLPGGAGSFQAQTHDTNGNVASRTDWNGNRTNYTFDLARNLETSRIEGLTSSGATTPQTRTISTEWHTTFRLPAAIAEPLRKTTFVYDADGTQCGARGALCSRSIQATTDVNGSQGFSATPTGVPRTWTYTYNANGDVLTVNGPRTDVADVTTYTYFANNDPDLGKRGKVATITNAAGHTTSFTAYNAHGQPLTMVDPNGLTTSMTYDARQRLETRTVGGETTSYDYDNAGQLTKVTLPDGSFLSYSYDSAHRLTEMQDNLGNRIAYTLDAMGNRTQEEVRDPANQLAQTRSRVINNLNRLFRELGAQSQTTEYAYDDQANVISIKDPLNRITSNQYDALNRLKQVTSPAPISAVTQYGYNGLDALTQVTDSRNLVTGYTVNGLGNLTQQTSPDTGTTTNAYDAAGNLVTQTDAKSQITTYAYDALNRVTLITFHDSSKQEYAYDLGANGIGRLSSITERNPANQVTSVIAYAYDQHGRATSETRTVGGVQYVLAYRYDSSGRLDQLTYPSGRTVNYTFDGLGRVSGATTTKPGNQAQTVVSGVAYHPFGGVKAYTLGNGQTYSRGIDLDGRVASYTLGNQSFSIGYDAASRIEFIAQFGNPANINGYGYDALDRLTSAVLPSTPYAYSYDAVGNRTSRTAESSTDNYAYGGTSNRIASITPASVPVRNFVFDANGSTTADGLNTYAYDVRGRMVQATSTIGATSYQVNALGQRIRKTNTLGDRVFHYDTGGRLIAETDAAGGLKRELIYLGDIPVGVVQ